MKKIIIIFLLGILCLSGCMQNKKEEKDYSIYGFTDINWTRDSGNDIETIKFESNGEFSYTCACGNPVNDADLCETYTYNNDTKEIKLECFEITEDTITTIKVVNFIDDILELEFDGELRTFKKENN